MLSLENYFYRILLKGVTLDIESELIALAISLGSSGASESLLFTQPDLTFDPRVYKTKSKTIDVFFEAEPPQTFFENIKELYPLLSYEIFKEEHKDWLSEWKKGFKPFCLINPYWVVPSWLESPVAPEHTIRIDPGMAFGTGTHATTQIAAYLIKKTLSKSTLPMALDVGTGTGILAILAERLGVQTVVGIDIDSECIRVANENIKLNHTVNTLIDPTQLDEVEGYFDLIIANIIDGVLIKLKEDLTKKLTPNGVLIVSGILAENEDRFFTHFIEPLSLKVDIRVEKEGWIGFCLKRATS